MPDLVEALTNPRIFELGLLYFCIVVGLYGIGFWMPQVLQTFGLSNLVGRLPHRHSLSRRGVGMVIAGRHSDGPASGYGTSRCRCSCRARRSRGRPMPDRLLLVMLALSLATLGIYAAIGTFWSLPTSILTGTGAAAGLALINSIGNRGGLSARSSSAS